MLTDIKNTVNKILIDPFRHGPGLTRRLLLILCANQTLCAMTYSLVPFLFYRPVFYCQNGETGQSVPCDQIEACKQPTLHYESEYRFDSISLDFGLFCSQKKTEATLLTIMMAGHFLGTLFATYLSKFASNQRNLMLILLWSNIVCAVGLLISVFAYSPMWVSIVFILWCSGMDVINSFLNCLPVTYYPLRMSKKVMGIQTASWPLYSIFLPALYAIVGNWRTFLFFFVGLPHIVIAYFFWNDLNELADFNVESVQDIEQEDQRQEVLSQDAHSHHSHQTPNNKHLALRVSDRVSCSQSAGQNPVVLDAEYVEYSEVYNNPHFRFILMYFFIYGGSYVAAFSSMTSLNTLSGNIYFNITFITILELVLSLTGNFLSHFFDVKNTLVKIYFMMALGYSAYTLMPGLIQYLIILQGKLFTDMTWVILQVYTAMLMPPRFLPFVFSFRSLYNLGIMLILPYTKYFLELFGLRIFVFSGFYELLVVVGLYHMKPTLKE